MSRFVQLSTMRDRAIAMCDLPPTLDTTTRPTAAQILDFLQVSATLLGGLVKESPAGAFVFAESRDLTTTSGAPAVSLPTETSEVLRVSWLKDANTEVMLTLATVDEMRDRPTGWEAAAPTYRVVGQTLELFPTPTGAYTLRVYYSSGIYPTSISSYVWCMDTWDQWIVTQTCIFVRAQQQRGAPEFEIALAALTQSIKNQLRRDRYGIKIVRDLRNADPQAWMRDPRRWGA